MAQRKRYAMERIKSVTVKLDAKVWSKFKAICALKGVTTSLLTEEVLKEYSKNFE